MITTKTRVIGWGGSVSLNHCHTFSLLAGSPYVPLTGMYVCMYRYVDRNELSARFIDLNPICLYIFAYRLIPCI